MNDPSVDVSSKDRAEILADLHHLGISTSQTNITKLRNQLRNALMERHPIHAWLNNSTIEELKPFYQRLFSTSYRRDLDRMKKEIATSYLKNHSEAPLSTLKCNMNGQLHSSLRPIKNIFPANLN